MSKKRRLIGLFCLLLAALIFVPEIMPAGNIAVVQAAKKGKKNGLVKVKGNYCYYRKGKLQKKTWKTIKRKKYYFKKDGNAAVGSCKIGKKYYIFNAKGQLITVSKNKKKIVKVRNVKYQVKGKGFAASGWSKDKKYYFGEDGKMCTGICAIKEKFYCFGQNGKYDENKTKELRSAAVYDKDMTDLYRLIGYPIKTEYYAGCYKPAWDPEMGKDGILTYKNFTVLTYKGSNGREVFMGVE